MEMLRVRPSSLPSSEDTPLSAVTLISYETNGINPIRVMLVLAVVTMSSVTFCVMV